MDEPQRDRDEKDLEVDAAEVTSVPVTDTKSTHQLENENSSFMRANSRKSVLAMIAVLVLAGLTFWFLNGEQDESNGQATADSEALSDQEEPDRVTVEQMEDAAREGRVVWNNSVQVIVEGYDQTNGNVAYSFDDSSMTLRGNGLPNHDTGSFPNANNPNALSEQNIELVILRAPVYTGEATAVRTFGYSLGGIKIEPGTAERDPATNTSIEAFNVSGVFDPGTDSNNAHVQPDGTYHYHGLPDTLVTTGEAHSNLIGFAVDGFPIYADHGYRDPTGQDGPVDHMTSSWRLKSGERPAGEPEGIYNGDYTTDFEYTADSGDLDSCNGRFTVTPEFPKGVYAYFVTVTFPFFGRCVMGEVLDTMITSAPQQGVGQPTTGTPPSGNPMQPR